MKINVALIGSRFFLDRTMKIVEEFAELNVIPLPFQNEIDTVHILRENLNQIDIAVLSGPLPYTFSKDMIEKNNLPIFFIPYDESTVISMLLYLSYHTGSNLSKLSFDVSYRRYVDNAYHELQIPMDDIYIIDYEHELDVQSNFEFHYRLWKEGKTHYAITSRPNVYDLLVSHQVPCYRMEPMLKSIRDIMEMARLKSETLLLDLARFAVINIRTFKSNEHWSIYAHDEMDFKIYQVCLNYAKGIGASITQRTGYISIYADRRKIQDLTENFDFPFIERIKEISSANVLVGVGLGWTNHDAEKHALIALQEGNIDRQVDIILVNENKEVMHLDHAKVGFTLRTTDKRLLEIAQNSGLNIKTLSKIENYWITEGKKFVSSGDLADGLNISRRLSQKILKQLVEQRYASVVGEEQHHRKGRPTLLYQLHF